MHKLSIDIETYSSRDISKAGLYQYADAPDFRVLLIAAAVDDGPVQVIDLDAIDTLIRVNEGNRGAEVCEANERRSPRREAGRAAIASRRIVFDDFCRWLNREDVTLHAFNAVFEWYCLGRAGFATPIERWRCTMVHGLYLGYGGGLDAMGRAVGLAEDKRKLSTGKALIRRFCVPDKNGRRVLPAQEPEKWALFQEYNRMDVEAERELAKRFAPWPLPEREQALWAQDAKMNAAGVAVDMGLVQAARAVWADEKAELLNEAALISGLENPNSLSQLKPWISAEMGADSPATLRKDDVKDLLADGKTPDCARRMLEIRQLLGKTSVSKYDALAAQAQGGNRARGLLQFYGAHTGRWSGRGIQVHNLPKPALRCDQLDYARGLLRLGEADPHRARQALNLCFGSLPDTLSQLIRTVLVAGDGNTFAVADYSAIEARVVAWLAGEAWVNEVFATHGRIYEAAASQMFGVPLEKIRKGNPEYALRAKGKVATLALGYGGGPAALCAMGALKMGLREEELPDIVSRWRKANSRIRALWHDLEDAAVAVVKYGARRDVQCLKLRLEFSDGRQDWYLTIELPSGRKLFYARPKLDVNQFGKEAVFFQAQGAGGFRYQSTWGGTLTENVVQAIARDCLAELLLRIEAANGQRPDVRTAIESNAGGTASEAGEGPPAEAGGAQAANAQSTDGQRPDVRTASQGIRFHVHDEVIVEVAAAGAETRLEELLSLMAAPIPWAPGLLLKGEGFLSNYYRKD